MKISYHVIYMITSCCGVLFATTSLTHKKSFHKLLSVYIQNIICRNSLDHYWLTDLFARPQLDRLSNILPSIIDLLSVHCQWWFCLSVLQFFLPEVVHDTLVSYAWCDLVLPDTLVSYAWRGLALPDNKSCDATTAQRVRHSASWSEFYSQADTCFQRVVWIKYCPGTSLRTSS